ncbi:MAG: VTT domain-containing protein [Halieaceae bacterium]|jgi:phosphatidylserine/phosphatidylglycerophosphate/cardiolipin synthase-like enzyme/uncharacterized membrane protein YdjX (TVP38/TMEM64 family)|nr:VTT domain-containing protein [Halieaceae bacterium]
MSETANETLFSIGENCWRCETARQIAVAIDGESYFRAVREAILAARHRVMILGWDIHSKLRLVRGGEDDGLPVELGDLLDHVAKNQSVDVYLLSWDFAMIYLLERETLPSYTFDRRTHARVRFQLDGAHPQGASQHQKIVVVDDVLAFCGGIDLSQWRWDSSEHRPDDERRTDPAGDPYQPFHDLQMAVDGDAAAALAELARERWRRATDEALSPVPAGVQSIWPPSLEPVFRDASVAIARTEPAYDGRDAVQEVQQLYLDIIAAATRYIYIENQYLTAHCIAGALVERLGQSDGPEVVIVMPQKTGGWLEQQTMDVVRGRVVRQLEEADTGNRLRLYYPQVSASGDVFTMVHAKLLIADDRWLLLGSANLSNRSMALDSECNLALQAQPDSDTARALRQLLAELLAQHLAREPAEVGEVLQREQSLITTIDALREGEHTLRALDASVDPTIDELVPDSALVDPEKPMDAELFVSNFVPEDYRPHSARRIVMAVITMAALLGLAAAWRWTPLGEMLDLNQLVEQARELNAQPLTPVLVILLFGLAAALAIPLTLLVIAAVLAFGAPSGFLYSLLGAQLGALLTYGVGHMVGGDLVRRHAGKTLNAVSRRLSRRGVLAILTLRIVPVAPFAVINLVAGASHISLRDFALGTLLGLLPGITAISLFAEGVAQALREPGVNSVSWVVGLLVVLVLGGLWLRKLLQRRQASTETRTGPG